MLIFYMNDFFEEFQSFDDLYEFLRDHFLSRIEWIKLRLFFKKMHLFENKMKALKIIHCVDDFIKILKNRIKKIAKWLISADQTDVRVFMKAVEIIKQWIQNFAELFKSLTRLTDKVNWRWTDSIGGCPQYMAKARCSRLKQGGHGGTELNDLIMCDMCLKDTIYRYSEARLLMVPVAPACLTCLWSWLYHDRFETAVFEDNSSQNDH
jgi:hypothetical protein